MEKNVCSEDQLLDNGSCLLSVQRDEMIHLKPWSIIIIEDRRVVKRNGSDVIITLQLQTWLYKMQPTLFQLHSRCMGT